MFYAADKQHPQWQVCEGCMELAKFKFMEKEFILTLLTTRSYSSVSVAAVPWAFRAW